jgi:uncharacterized membrane protein YidH (DUF202 family)
MVAPARDPAAQPERTRLAWLRTNLAATAVALLGARLALRDGTAAPRLVALTIIALALAGLLALTRGRTRGLDAARPPAMSPPVAALAAGCVVTVAVCGATLVR